MKKIFLRILVIAAPIRAAAMLLLLRPLFFELSRSFAPCIFNKYFGIWCSSCGNTRAVLNLLHGNILSSLRYNVTPVLLLTVAALFWGELIARAFGKKLILYPRRPAFSYALVGIMILYYVVRNFIPFLMPI